MPPQLSIKVSQAWDHYINLPKDDRQSYLEQLHVEDAELANALESLLAQSQKQTKDDLNTPIPQIPETVKPETVDWVNRETASDIELPTLPGYEVLSLLGRGGMGVVYKARHLKLNRVVALKMIRAKVEAEQSEIDRFRTEAEAVARLQHPHIVQIHEIGELHGLPYFSLEFCAGGTLEDQLNGTPWQPKAAAALVETLARAIQAAHEAQVIHRDLKPQNVLMGGQAETDRIPKITDFGLAKKLDVDEGMTHSGAIMGTPAYMAPEQARGITKEIGPSVDIYALGVILYQLLTGRPPFMAASMWDTIEQVIYEEPVSPRRLNPKVPKDLETICLKCLQKDPSRRYANALQLNEDLQRFSRDDPIHARAIGPIERAWRWCRRRPAVASLLSAVVLITVIGFSLVSWKWQQAEANFAESERQRIRREANFKKSIEAVDQMLTRVGDESLREVPGMSEVRRKLLEDALEFYEGFINEKSNDPDVIKETARVLLKTGDIYVMLEKREQAEKAFKKSIELYNKAHSQFSDRPEFHRGLAIAHVDLANHYYHLDRYQDAEPLLRKAITAHESLVADHPQKSVHKLDLALARKTLGSVLRFTAREKEAEKMFLSALSVYAGLEQSEFNSRRCRDQRALCLYALGAITNSLGKPEVSDKYNLEAVEVQKALANDFPEVTEYQARLAQFYQVLAVVHMRRGELNKAQRWLEDSINTLKKVIAQFPLVPTYRYNLAGSYNIRAIVHARQGKTKEIGDSFELQAEMLAALVTDFPDRIDFRRALGRAYHNLGVFMFRAKKIEQAIDYYKKGLEERRKLAKTKSNSSQSRVELAGSCSYLALALPEEKHEEAIQLLQEAIQLNKSLTDENPDNPTYWHKLAQSYRVLGDKLIDHDTQRSAKNLNEAMTIYRRLIADYPKDARFRRFLVDTVDSLAQFQEKLNNKGEAEKFYREAVSILENLTKDFPENTEFRQALVTGQEKLAQFLSTKKK